MIAPVDPGYGRPKGPSALENSLQMINALMGLGMQVAGAKEAFSAKPPPAMGQGNYQLNAEYKPKIQPMFTAGE